MISSLSYEVELLSRMVEIDTNVVTGEGYREFAKHMVEEARQLGLEVKVHDAVIEAEDGRTRPNVIVNLNASSDQTVILAAHYDTVPPGEGWKHEPLRLTVEGDRGYGRGACDNKGDIAAAFGALRELSKKSRVKRNVVLALTPDEEVGGQLGLGFLARKNLLKGEGAVVLDGSPEAVVVGTSGVVWGSITIHGVGGHAGYPHKALNPIEKAIPILEGLKKYSQIRQEKRSSLPSPPGSPFEKVWGRFTVTMMKAGIKENVIPSSCEIRFDMRLCPEENPGSAVEQFRKYFQTMVKKYGLNAKLTILKQWPPSYIDPQHPLVEEFREAVSWALKRDVETVGELVANDAQHIYRKIPTVTYGVIRGDSNVHGADECVRLKDVQTVRDVLIKFCSGE
ncbi:MAG: M20/M25/M40 family metallo-hydrolase [Candidatus Bathyarchaeia archaeon]